VQKITLLGSIKEVNYAVALSGTSQYFCCNWISGTSLFSTKTQQI